MKDFSFNHFVGLNNVLPVERVRSMETREDRNVELTECVNVDFDNTSKFSRRPGQTMKAAGAAHSLWADEGQCLYIAGGSMFSLSTSFAPTELAAGLSTSPMAYVAANSRVYHSNGEIAAVLDGGRVRSWGMDIDAISINGVAIDGQMPAGTYLFAMTHLRADGQESGTGAAKTIDLPEGGGIQFTWAVPDDLGIEQCAIYVSQPNGETLMQAVVLDIEQETSTYIGGSRSLPLATQWLDAPPPGRVLATYNGRIYIGVGDVVYATAALSYEHCDLRDYRAFDGSTVTMIAAVESGLFIGTETAVYFMAGASFADASLVKKIGAGAVFGSVAYANGEAVTGRAEQADDTVALFTTSEGVIVGWPNGSITNLTRERFQMPSGAAGAAIFDAGASSKYLLSMS